MIQWDYLGMQLFPGQEANNPMAEALFGDGTLDTQPLNLFDPHRKDDIPTVPAPSMFPPENKYSKPETGLAMYECKKTGFGGACNCANGNFTWWALAMYDCRRVGFPIAGEPPILLNISFEVEGTGDKCPDFQIEFPNEFRKIMGPVVVQPFDQIFTEVQGLVEGHGPGYNQ
jgi:hypothetical protein